MKKIALLLPAVLLSFGALAAPAAADDGADADQPVGDPGVAALHDAVAAFREARSTEDACRGAQASEQCKDVRSEARATFQTVRADAILAHHEFRDKLQTWKNAKTPEEKAAILADLKAQAAEARAVIGVHRDEVTALRGRLNDELAKLDRKGREELRQDAKTREKAAREKNTAELTARLRVIAAKRPPSGENEDNPNNPNNPNNQNGASGNTGNNGGSATGTRPLPTRSPAVEPPISPRPSGPTEIHSPTATSSPRR